MSTNEQNSPPAATPQQPQIPSTTQNAAASENLACQWQGCGERCASAEQLYDHVCERHVGRKSTNNLNLTCQWGTCRTTTVKRDHITSHIRVHVPLKPHKCEFCGKAFKRPQDLKKHVKTHADDSVILRSPEPTGGARPATNNVYNVSNGKTFADNLRGFLDTAPSYYETPVTGQGYNNHANPQYYQPQHQQQHNSSYGSVYYATMNQGADIGNQANYESRKRGYQALDQFFADLKRRNFDPASYAAVGERLMALQGLQLPDVIVPSYQPAPVMIAAGGHGGHHGGPIAPAPYVLPPMPNLRTKNDLTSIDHFLEQMQATVYENDNQVAAAGVGQPGAHYVPSGMHYRGSHSPPSVQLPSSHQTATGAPMMANTSSQSPHSGTPALTPPSSAQSYTSGHSPVSLPSHHFSPQQQTSSGMYPTLPATTAHENMENSYSTATAPTSTLATMFDNDARRRFSGGMLQRAAPSSGATDVMDSAMSDSSATPPAKSPTVAKASKPEIASSLIDPALGGNGNAVTSPAAHSDSIHSDEKNAVAEKAEELWVENIRVIEALRQYVQERLEKREYVGEDGLAVDAEDQEDGMEGVEHGETSREAEKEKELAYPVLRGLEA